MLKRINRFKNGGHRQLFCKKRQEKEGIKGKKSNQIVRLRNLTLIKHIIQILISPFYVLLKVHKKNFKCITFGKKYCKER